ncbi:MAG TPA: glycosyltransferase [Gemmatimonadales bacterium]|nr:glycosyltransferase [Gemmatimonadales bacterium]
MTPLCAGVLAAALAFAAYAYLGYPVLLMLMAARRRPRPAAAPLAAWPHITIVLPVYNEEAVIRRTLANLLQLDYPPDRRQIVVVSDASTDRTDAIVHEYAARGVRLLRLPRRGGKTAAENTVRPLLRGEIIVNTDASAHVGRDALKPLIAAFADPTVGVASGHYVSVARIQEQANYAESWYVSYDMWVRHLETRVAGIVGAAGCFHAVRAPIQMQLLPEVVSRDFAAGLLARERGWRAVSVKDAICLVPRAPSLRREYRRKVRTITRGWHTLLFKRRLLNPVRYGAFAWILASHKICRWVIPHVTAVGLAALVCLAAHTAWARWGLGALALGATAAALAWWWPEGVRLPRLFAVPGYLVMGNVAALHASVRVARGQGTPLWEPTRREPVWQPDVAEL